MERSSTTEESPELTSSVSLCDVEGLRGVLPD